MAGFCKFTIFDTCPGSGSGFLSLHTDPDPTVPIQIRLHGSGSASPTFLPPNLVFVLVCEIQNGVWRIWFGEETVTWEGGGKNDVSSCQPKISDQTAGHIAGKWGGGRREEAALNADVTFSNSFIYFFGILYSYICVSPDERLQEIFVFLV